MRLRICRLRCEQLHDPLGIDESNPWLSWAVEGDAAPTQTRVTLTAQPRGPDPPFRWESGLLPGSAAGVTYDGPALGSRTRATWTVAALVPGGQPVASDTATFEIGLAAGHWRADWIGLPWPDTDPDRRPCPHLRTMFDVPEGVVRGRLYIAALGAFRAAISGQPVSDELLAPGWRDYRKRAPYRTYDVTDLLQPGKRALAVLLGEAWWSGSVGLRAQRHRYGTRPHLRVQLEMVLADGTTSIVVSDGTWRGAFGAQLRSDLLLGEINDARLQLDGWTTEAYDDGAWTVVSVDAPDAGGMVAMPGPAVRVIAEHPVVDRSEPRPGTRIVDFGQNAAAFVRLTADGPEGARVEVRHGEALAEDGSLYTANLRLATGIDTYTLRGGVHHLEPSFTAHGFRYAQITTDVGVTIEDARSCAVATDLERTGWFECSDGLLNRIAETIVASQRSNTVGVPTDCPQRDERLGWLGDAYVFGPTAVFNFDLAAWLSRWYDDILDAQGPDGSFPDVVPFVEPPDLPLAEGAPGWGDAGVTLPWLLYTWYGNPAILRRAYPAAQRWVDLIARCNPDHLWRHRRGNDYGDWLGYEVTDKQMLATAIFARTAATLGDIAEALDDDAGAQRARRLAEGIRETFVRTYVGDDGSVVNGTQTAYAVALRFGLVPPALRQAAGDRLADHVQACGQIGVGYLGVAHLLPALTDTGHVDLAYDLVQSTEVPSWGAQIEAGATTFWERWDGWTAEHGFCDPQLNSLNHVTLGSVGEWLRASIAGLDADPANPGFGNVLVAPRPGGGLTSAEARLLTVRGEVEVAWQRAGDELSLTVTVPATATATVCLPAAAGASVSVRDEAQIAQRTGPTVVAGPGTTTCRVRGVCA